MKSETEIVLNVTDKASRLARDHLRPCCFEDPAGGGGIGTARPDAKRN